MNKKEDNKLEKNLPIRQICLVTQEYPDETNFGGIATYMYYLSRGLSNRGVAVFVIARSYIKDSYFEYENIKIYRICEYSNLKYRARVADLLVIILNENDIDLIETPEWGADLYEYFCKYRHTYKTPVVVKLHTPHFVWKKYNKCTLGETEVDKMEKRVICEADGLFSCTHALKNIVASEYQILESNITVIPNMIEINEEIQSSNVNIYSIVFVGSLEQRKGVFVLADAFKLIKQKVPNVTLTFIGKDTNRNQWGSSTRELLEKTLDGFNDVVFIDQVKNNHIEFYMRSAGVLTFPSIFENFPYVVLEAMRFGKAIVGSQNGGMSEMITDGVDGLLYNPPNHFELAEKLMRLLSNKGLSQAYGLTAQLNVRKFNTELILDEYFKYYSKIIASHAG